MKSPGLTGRIGQFLSELEQGDGPLVKRALWGLGLQHRVIYEDNGVSPYLTRHFLTPRGDWWRERLPGVYPHWFHRGDLDRELHSHPWEWSASLILWGGYEDERIVGSTWRDGRTTPYIPDWRSPTTRTIANTIELTPHIEKKVYRPGSWSVLHADTFHRVSLLDPRGCLTLFVAGPRVGLPDDSSWGFLSRDGVTYETIGERERRVKSERDELAAAQQRLDESVSELRTALEEAGTMGRAPTEEEIAAWAVNNVYDTKELLHGFESLEAAEHLTGNDLVKFVRSQIDGTQKKDN